MSSLNKVIVFGAHGKIGQHLIKLFAQKASPYTATAVIRNEEQAKRIAEISQNSSNITTTSLSLSDATAEELSKAIEGHDVVVFTAGSGGKNVIQVDLDGAVKTFEASVLAKTRRYVLISALNADKRNVFSQTAIRDYYIAKHYADRILADEYSDSLDYTILQPGALLDSEATGKIHVFPKSDKGETGAIPRADVADVIYQTIGKKSTYGKTIGFVGGDNDISSALE
ncbi:NAD(P)-binding protein [Suhomyces tanzawaensis NRRL Y-17324]|uniref:NAD(P)-binding protein n=1 Tax=Suhomyces tanzawaensis NRRL Y-17324 TaxID=984487 RepID=A0A1E4SCK7_9ASCO|nr:NAD(P)-binding protein [Suhomyces tanzawaensis NRRL Y-17324]ODV77196.1 NAD(P)-binding protein [Suhomyces tanzawaensis NRRL Y-17324]